jgi:hypothetical protein
MEAAGLGHVPAQMVDELEVVWRHAFPPGYNQVWGDGRVLAGAPAGRAGWDAGRAGGQHEGAGVAQWAASGSRPGAAAHAQPTSTP